MKARPRQAFQTQTAHITGVGERDGLSRPRSCCRDNPGGRNLRR